MEASITKILWTIVAQQNKIQIWTIFVVIHLFFFVVILFVLWWFEITAQDVVLFVKTVIHGRLVLVLGIFGVSVYSIVRLYVKGYKTISSRLASKFLFQPLYGEAKKND
jgi:hypothetical protein